MSAYGQVPDKHKVASKEGHHRPYVAGAAVLPAIVHPKEVVS